MQVDELTQTSTSRSGGTPNRQPATSSANSDASREPLGRGESAGHRRVHREGRRPQKGFAQAETASESTGSKLKNLGKVALAAAGAAGLGALVYTLHTGITEFTDHAKVAAQTGAVLKSTGGAAHVTAKHVDELAGALLEKSGVDDEVIQSGENMLLTFRNIRNEAGKGNDIFDQPPRPRSTCQSQWAKT